ncbi:apolipoprotein D-like [Rhopalosiphum maidis]|nr:apolipoprotein D-like [Rhopalosiphum maidis]XP_060851805.1 apolipoprotein D-like [Rhopalosiphum padi]
MMFNTKLVVLLVCTSVAMVSCQVPAIGGCPDFDSQPDFDMNRYLGTWYEAEHYVNIFEIGTRCVKTNYTKAVDGRYLVSNEIMNRFTGVKRVLDGEIRLIVKGAESKMNVKYTTLPISYSTEQMILETDYDSFAVVWSCSSYGVANTQNAWIMTREKLAPGTVMQKAYGVLDKYKLSKSYFRKTDQNSCAIAEAAPNETTNENKWRRRRSLN